MRWRSQLTLAAYSLCRAGPVPGKTRGDRQRAVQTITVSAWLCEAAGHSLASTYSAASAASRNERALHVRRSALRACSVNAHGIFMRIATFC